MLPTHSTRAVRRPTVAVIALCGLAIACALWLLRSPDRAAEAATTAIDRVARLADARPEDVPPTLAAARVSLPGIAAPSRAVDGLFLKGRIEGAGLDDALVEIGTGTIDPADLDERAAALARGETAPPLDELFEYTTRAVAAVAAGGSDRSGEFGPVGVPHADRYEVLVRSGSRFAAKTVARESTSPCDGVIDAGAIELPPASGFRLRRIGDDFADDAWIELSRDAPSPEGSRFVRLLHRIDARLGAALGSGERIRFPAEGNLLLAPLPPGEAIRMTLSTARGRRTPPIVRVVPRNAIEDVVLDAAALSPRSRGLRVRLRWSPSGDTVSGATIEDALARSIGTSASDGSFDLPIDERRPPAFAVTRFDPVHPDRRHCVELPLESERDADEITIEIRRYRWLHAAGLAPPYGVTAPEPLAYVLEMQPPGEPWRPIACDVFRNERASSDSVAASVTTGEALYRITAVWTPVFLQESAPVALLESEVEAYTTFAAPADGPVFVRGRVVDAAGRPVADAEVAATAASGTGGVPPSVLRSDSDGRFALGPVLAPRIEIECASRLGRGSRTIDPRREAEVEIEVR